MKTVFIYCLKCPMTGDVRYIGQTVSPKKRLKEHLKDSSKKRNHLGRWLRSLSEPPVLVILHEVAENESWAEEERRYISCARALGVDLVNTTDGGEGASGPKSPEHREAISAALMGVPKSPEARAAMSAARKGVPRLPETCAAISAALTGVPKSPEHCAAQSAAKKGMPLSPAQHAANEAQRGVPWSPARRATYEAGKLAKSGLEDIQSKSRLYQ